MRYRPRAGVTSLRHGRWGGHGRGDRRPVSRGPHWTRGTGVALIAFGWVYPHFLEGPAVAYLYASPVGLVPCPTLAMGVGFALLGNGLGSRVWGLTLATVGLFYGLFGVLHLAVFLDIALVAGAMALIAAEFRPVDLARLVPITNAGE